MHKVLYNKWRPASFKDVVGQDHITTTLKNEVAAGKPAHAYLLCGTRGTGKTTCAKILAKALNCPNQADGDPCGECDICKGIDNGSILDVTEIDAASNNGVDNIRDLREEAFYTPVVCKYRVYIIDETHMLSQGAFNALLKIMEEPPAHVVFILATTEIHKVPATIMSRCQRFDFRRIPSGIIAERLLHIAENEDFTVAPDGAELIAQLSDGGMRDAISLLDLCVSTNNDVTAEAVRTCAGLVDKSYLFSIAQAVSAKDSGQLFTALEDVWGKSVDYQRLCEQLIGFYRNLMIAKAVPDSEEFIACLPDERSQYHSMAQSCSIDDIMHCLDVLQEALIRMSRVSARRTELEMALIRLCGNKPSAALEDGIAKRIEQLENKIRAGISAPKTQANTASKPDPAPSSEEIRKTKVDLFDKWEEVLEILKQKNKALYGALASSKAYTGKDLFLVDAGELFANLVRNDSYAKESLREAIIGVTGRKYRLGPYNPAKYEVSKEENKLEALLNKANELGVDVNIT